VAPPYGIFRREEIEQHLLEGGLEIVEGLLE